MMMNVVKRLDVSRRRCWRSASNLPYLGRVASRTSTPSWAKPKTNYAMAKTLIWWDVDNTPLPAHPCCTSNLQIDAALRTAGYRGPLKLFVYGDLNNLTADATHLFYFAHPSQVVYTHVPPGDENASFKIMLTDMMLSTLHCAPPANYLLISSNERFEKALWQLGGENYNVLLARPLETPCDLDNIAWRVWNWEDLVEGAPPLPPVQHENLVWQYFRPKRGGAANILEDSDTDDTAATLEDSENDDTAATLKDSVTKFRAATLKYILDDDDEGSSSNSRI